MKCKFALFIRVWLFASVSISIADLPAADYDLPAAACIITGPPGWSPAASPAFVLRGPVPHGRTEEAPRLAITIAEADIATTASSLRDGLMRVADGCEILDDDQIPLGGRVWRRIKTRFAAGPMAFGQYAWIGTVEGRTLVVVLSAPDDVVTTSLAPVSAAIATIRPAR